MRSARGACKIVKKQRLLLVDGYNVLNAWKGILSGRSLADARDQLVARLHDYAGTQVRTGFIHVPYIPGQGTPCMELELITKALEVAIRAC